MQQDIKMMKSINELGENNKNIRQKQRKCIELKNIFLLCTKYTKLVKKPLKNVLLK